MLHCATLLNIHSQVDATLPGREATMPVSVQDHTYFTANEVCDEVQVTRQTLWRWRQGEKVPQGRKYRGREVLFTEEEVARIRAYAHRLEPLESADPSQMKLFEKRRETK